MAFTSKPPPFSTKNAALNQNTSSKYLKTRYTRKFHSFCGQSTSTDRPSSVSSPFASLNEGIAKFYDASTGLWENIWGDHLHHGYYRSGAPPKSNRQAQEDMIEEVLSWADVQHVTHMADIGCGLGGSSRHIARKYPQSTAQGITLSSYQAQRGNEISKQQNLGDRVALQVADALHQPFADASFDLVWSLESGEHMPDKRKFVSELVRVAMPGGKIIIVTWCHRVLQPGESALQPQEQALLQRINDAYYLPDWCSIEDYKKLFEEFGMHDIKIDDWSQQVAPFWGEVIKTALTPEGILGLLGAGWTTIKGALVMPLMAQGFRMNLVRFVLITGVKRT